MNEFDFIIMYVVETNCQIRYKTINEPVNIVENIFNCISRYIITMFKNQTI